MVDERESPSAGWREVYDEMGADPNAEAATHSCPDCGRACENVLRDVYECEDHGVFRASADRGDEGGDSSNAGRTEETSTGDPEATPTDDLDENSTRASGRAD